MSPEPDQTLRGMVDMYVPPGEVRGWVYAKRDGQLQPGLHVQVRRGADVLASTQPDHPRQDATGDAVYKSGFTLYCPDAGVEDFLSHAITIWAVSPSGAAVQLQFRDKTLEKMQQERLLGPWRQASAQQAGEMLEALSASANLAPVQALSLRAAKSYLDRASLANATRPVKICFIGAGSTVFAKNLLGDILLHPALAASHIYLYDINPERLRVSLIVARRINAQLGQRAEITATTEITEALAGANYAINMIQVGGYEPATVTDFELPKKFGLRQTIADTMGIGGIMRGLRTIPVLLEMCRQMERLCPDVLHINYTNPMAMNCWALSRASAIKTIGLCHAIPHTAAELAHDLGLPVDAIDYQVAGINHMAFYLKFESRGEDLYPRLRALAASGSIPPGNRVRYDMLMKLGYFVTESSEHFAEYVPWYIKSARPDLIERFNIPLDEYPRRCRAQIQEWEHLSKALTSLAAPLTITPSQEYGARIINAIETGTPAVIYGNVPNTGLISNLPEGCCVELPCLVDTNGIQPTRIGALPVQLAALMQTNIAVQGLAVEAALTGRREHIYHAAMLDPHTAAELSLDEIFALVDEMLAAHKDFLPVYT